jgi:5'-nucleotidase
MVDGDRSRPGIQPLKEWVALADELKSFPDADGDGVPDTPRRYAAPEGRYASVPSWSPISLLAGAGLLTFGLLVVVVLIVALAVVLIRRGVRRRRRKNLV